MKTWQTGVMVAKKKNSAKKVKTWKQAPLALHASSCSTPLGVSCSCFRAFAFPLLVLLRSCIHGLHLDRNSGATPYRVIGVDKCHLSQILFVESLSQ